jgi:glyoxalase family protein
MVEELAGLHHVSALSARIGRTHDFYTRVLGMRPIIRTVNQDAPTMYHLFYGDGAARPGSEITFFDMPRAAAERAGNNSISRTTLRVAGLDALDYWADRFRAERVAHGTIEERGGRLSLEFSDPLGTRLSLVDDGGVGEAHAYAGSPVPTEQQVRGLGYTELTVPALAPTAAFLQDALGLRESHRYVSPEEDAAPTHVFEVGPGGVHAEVHVVVRPELPRARYGSGGVHHVALRVPEGQRIGDWAERLDSRGVANSGVVDRHYFASLYAREPNGVLFELATDGPGFEVDGPLDADRLSLPPALEPNRAAIEAALRPLVPEDR